MPFTVVANPQVVNLAINARIDAVPRPIDRPRPSTYQ